MPKRAKRTIAKREDGASRAQNKAMTITCGDCQYTHAAKRLNMRGQQFDLLVAVTQLPIVTRRPHETAKRHPFPRVRHHQAVKGPGRQRRQTHVNQRCNSFGLLLCCFIAVTKLSSTTKL